MPTGPEEAAASALLAAIAHLAGGRHAEADALLAEVDAALAGSTELDDVRARVASLRAQALLALGRAGEAREHCRAAMRLARDAGDDEGLQEVRALDERIAAELDRGKRADRARDHARTLADTPVDALLARTDDALALADALIKHAGALALVGRHADAAVSARLAVQHADRGGAVRERVLARLALVEADPSGASVALLQALSIADQADEPTLIGLVARAAELAGVELPGHRGPLEGRPA